MEINKFYKNKKILITGHNGFKGAWLTLWLKKMGAIVKGVSLKGINDNHFRSLKIDIEEEHYDISNFNKINKTILDFKPDTIFHLAAQSIVGDSYIEPLSTFRTNIIGTTNILEICRNFNFIKSIIIVTSDKVYEPSDKVKNVETDRIGGVDPYSASKAASDVIFNSYLNSFYLNNKINIASVRAGNVLGGGDWSQGRLIPDAIRSIKNKNKLNVRDPEAIRPWQFVLDCLYGYLLLNKNLYKNDQFQGNWNFGPSENQKKIKVEYILKYIQNRFANFNYQYSSRIPFKESKVLMVSSSKANQLLGWKPYYNLNQTLFETIDWYQGYLNNSKNNSEVMLNRYLTFLNEKKN